MNDERVISTPAPSDLATFRILVDGQEISSEYHVATIAVTKAVNRIPAARIVLLDGDTAKEDFEITGSDDLVPGKKIEVLAGYHSEETTVFKGIVTGNAIKSRKSKPSVLTVGCRDEAVKMTVGRKSAYYHDVTDSDVLEEIINGYGLSPDVEATQAEHKEMVKYNTTDWDFVVSRADVNGKLVMVDDGKVSVKAPDTGQDPALALVYGSTIIEFEAEMDSRSQLAGIKSTAWDIANQELLEQESGEPEFSEAGNIKGTELADVMEADEFFQRHTGRRSDQELKAWADARMLRSRLAKIIGRVKCQGFGEIRPGEMLSLNGVGERFKGNLFVTAVRHNLTVKNWETDIQFGLASKWFACSDEIIDVPAAGLLPAVQGLQIGVVTQLQDDPDDEDRVMVRMPVIDQQEEGVWARIASLDAGNERGAFFRPEIGDEVVMGFLNEDPRDPVVLGMLNSSAKPAPLKASDDNHEKGIFTRSKMRLIFDDDKKSVTVDTPNGNSVTLSDDEGSIVIQDENGNKIEMTSDGITIESSGDINIKASGAANIESADANVKASGQFKAEGSSGAEVSSGGTTVVKGSLVQIN